MNDTLASKWLPGLASGEDSKAAEEKTKKAEPAEKKATSPAKPAADPKAAPKGDAAKATATECQPKTKLDFNTFEDLYGARDWSLQTAAHQQSDPQATVVWRDAAAEKKPAPEQKPAAKNSPSAEKKPEPAKKAETN